MFRKRLAVFSLLLLAVALLIAGRLVQIQIYAAPAYAELAERILVRPVRYIHAPRGAVYDRNGRPLLCDEASWDLAVHFGALTESRDYLTRVARGLVRSDPSFAETPLAELVTGFLEVELPQMWRRLSELTGVTEAELRANAARAVARIERQRDLVRRNSRGQITRIKEQDELVPILGAIDSRAALAVRRELEERPWVRVLPGARRVARDADSLAHVLGRMGAASPDRIAADPLRGVELRELRPGDRCGVSGVEYLADVSLRGQRGRILQDFNWQEIARSEPRPGHDVFLTIDRDLQEQILGLLEQAVAGLESPAGAAAVVIDVATRDILALVSYPTFSYADFNRDFDALVRDAVRQPLLFRAVTARYPPGSICKAMTLIGGLSEGVVTPATRFHCRGYLLPEFPDRFRCWIYNQYQSTHDAQDERGQDAESAVRNSCNIYFFQVGERLGPEWMCEWFGRFGLGQPPGTGLVEESPATLPTELWLRETQKRGYQPADAWNFAIGQGEVTITPLQAANVAATIASGNFAPPRLAYDDTGHAFGAAPGGGTTFDEQHMAVLRRGMWKVVNDAGTGREAKLSRGDYELCGKTGSAQAVPWPVTYRYTFEWPDGRREEVDAFLEADAREPFGDDQPRCVGKRWIERYPDWEQGEKMPSHAWFVGYTQPAGMRPGARPVGGAYAIAVILEYGGSGGHVAAPVARQIAECVLEREGAH
ncbi:MAG: penicillin-binding transpeptidase domain-containing protein [Planctomycetota bacterium]